MAEADLPMVQISRPQNRALGAPAGSSHQSPAYGRRAFDCAICTSKRGWGLRVKVGRKLRQEDAGQVKGEPLVARQQRGG